MDKSSPLKAILIDNAAAGAPLSKLKTQMTAQFFEQRKLNQMKGGGAGSSKHPGGGVGDNVNSMGSAASLSHSRNAHALYQSHQRIYMARISGPQVLEKARTGLNTPGQSTISSMSNNENQNNHHKQKMLKTDRQYKPLNILKSTEIQPKELVLEFKNGMTLPTEPEKKMSFKDHRRMLKYQKIPNMHECFSFEYDHLSSIHTSKSGDNLFMSDLSQRHRKGKSNDFTSILSKNRKESPLNSANVTQMNYMINQNGTNHSSQLQKHGMRQGRTINQWTKQKMKPNKSLFGSKVTSGQGSFIGQGLDSSNERQIKTAGQTQRPNKRAVMSGNLMSPMGQIQIKTVTPQQDTFKIQTKEVSNRRNKNQSRNSAKDRTLTGVQSMSGLSQEEILVHQARDRTKRKLDKRIENSNQLKLSEDQLHWNYYNTEETDRFNRPLGNRSQYQSKNNKNISRPLKSENPILAFAKQPDVQNSVFDEFENTIKKQIQNMKDKFGQGVQKQMIYNKMNDISLDHMKQLLSRNKSKISENEKLGERKPTLQDTLSQADEIFQSLPKATLSTKHLHQMDSIANPTTYKFQEVQQRVFSANAAKTVEVLSPNNPVKQKGTPHFTFKDTLNSIGSQNDTLTGKNVNAQHQRTQTLTSINEMINQMIDDEFGTPIRNSLHDVMMRQKKKESQTVANSINNTIVSTGAQIKIEGGDTLETVNNNFKTSETGEDGQEQIQKQTLIPMSLGGSFKKSLFGGLAQQFQQQQDGDKQHMNIREDLKPDQKSQNVSRQQSEQKRLGKVKIPGTQISEGNALGKKLFGNLIQKQKVKEPKLSQEDQLIQGRVKKIYEIKQIEKRMQTNPNVQNIVQNKTILDQSFLSPLTIVENNIVGLTSDHLINKTNTRVIGKIRKDHGSMHDKLKRANWEIMSVQNELKKIVDNGEFHTPIWLGQMLDITLPPRIPKCFIIELREFENPFVIKIRYPNQMAARNAAAKSVQFDLQPQGDLPTGELALQKKHSILDSGESSLDKTSQRENVSASDLQLLAKQRTSILSGTGSPSQNKQNLGKQNSMAIGQQQSVMQSSIFEEKVEDLNVYGSFTEKEPTEDNATLKVMNNPKKVSISELSNTKKFKSKFYYLTLESVLGNKVQIMAQNPQDEESIRKKRMMEKKKQAAKLAGQKEPVIQKPGGLCAKQKEEIQKAMRDKQFSNEVIDRMNWAQQSLKSQQQALYVAQEKDLMLINKEQVQNYINNLQAQMIHRRDKQEYYQEFAHQRNTEIELMKREKQLWDRDKWHEFRLERKKAIEKYIQAKAIQRKSEQLFVIIKRGLWVRQLAKNFKEYNIKRTREKKIEFCMFRAKFYWKKYKGRIRAEIHSYVGDVQYGPYKMKQFKVTKNWDEIYTNYLRNYFTLSQNCLVENKMDQSKEIFEPIMREFCEKLYMKRCFTQSYEQYMFIQKRMIRCSNSKKFYYNQLRELWAQKVQQIQARAMSKKKSQQQILEWTTALLRTEKEEYANTPLALLIKAFLEKYLYWCMLRYSIAFFQWRRKHKVKDGDNIKTAQDEMEAQKKIEQLEEVFDSKIGFIRKYSHKLYGMNEQIRVKALAKSKQGSKPESASKSPSSLEKKRKSSEKKISTLDVSMDNTLDLNQINHFHEIGWMNPEGPYKSFAGDGDENNIVRKNFDDLVYDKQFYMSGDFPPPVIFLPNDYILEEMIKKVADFQDVTIEELMSKFGISSICHICEEDIKNKESDRFRWPSDRKVQDCPHIDFHARCMNEAAKKQGVKLQEVECPVCLANKQD